MIAAAPAAARARGLGSVLAAALTCLVLAALIIVLTPRPVTQIAVPVSYQGDLVKFRRVAPYPVLAPRGLPPGWQPVSSRLTVVPGGAVSWHLGFVTPAGRMASLEESSRAAGSIHRADDEQRRPPAPDLGRRPVVGPPLAAGQGPAVDVPVGGGRLHDRGDRDQQLAGTFGPGRLARRAALSKHFHRRPLDLTNYFLTLVQRLFWSDVSFR